jgi:hypothetical protein
MCYQKIQVIDYDFTEKLYHTEENEEAKSFATSSKNIDA